MNQYSVSRDALDTVMCLPVIFQFPGFSGEAPLGWLGQMPRRFCTAAAAQFQRIKRPTVPLPLQRCHS